jgi:hypothetical protein
VLDGSCAVEEDADLPSGISGDFRQRAREFVVDDAVRLDAASREAFEGFDLAGLEAGGVAVDLNGVLLRASELARARREVGVGVGGADGPEESVSRPSRGEAGG